MKAFPKDFYDSVLTRPMPLQMKITRMLPDVRKRIHDALLLEGAPYIVYYADEVAMGALEVVAMELRGMGFKAEMFTAASPFHSADQPGLEITLGDMQLKSQAAAAAAVGVTTRKVCDECLKLPYQQAIECAHLPALKPDVLNALRRQMEQYRQENPDGGGGEEQKII